MKFIRPDREKIILKTKLAIEHSTYSKQFCIICNVYQLFNIM